MIRSTVRKKQMARSRGRGLGCSVSSVWLFFFSMRIFCGGLALLRVVNNVLDCLSACPNFLLSALAGRRTLPEDSRLKSIAIGFKSSWALYAYVFRNTDEMIFKVPVFKRIFRYLPGLFSHWQLYQLNSLSSYPRLSKAS